MSVTISVHNMFSPNLSLEFWCIELVIQLNEQSAVILWVSWCKNKSFWQRFTCIKNTNVPIFWQTICGVISKQGFSKKSRNLKILFRDFISLFGLKNKRWQWFYLNFWVALRQRTISRVFHLFVVCFSWNFFSRVDSRVTTWFYWISPNFVKKRFLKVIINILLV